MGGGKAGVRGEERERRICTKSENGSISILGRGVCGLGVVRPGLGGGRPFRWQAAPSSALAVAASLALAHPNRSRVGPPPLRNHISTLRCARSEGAQHGAAAAAALQIQHFQLVDGIRCAVTLPSQPSAGGQPSVALHCKHNLLLLRGWGGLDTATQHATSLVLQGDGRWAARMPACRGFVK